jgi:hypothetical protein
MKCTHELAEMETSCVDGMCPLCLALDLERWRSNHKDAVETKRGVEARLKTALAALQQVYTISGAAEAPDLGVALATIREISGNGFEEATTNKRDFLKSAAV